MQHPVNLYTVKMAEDSARKPRLPSGTSTESIDPSYRPKLLKRSGLSIESNEFDLVNQAKILVLYCGGTIGMKSHGGGKTLVQSRKYPSVCEMRG